MEWNPTFSLLGLGVGLLVGLTGTGGGSLGTPLLILLGVRPTVAVGTDLLYMAVTKALGAWQHWRQGTADLRVALSLALGSVPGALVGVRLLGRWMDDPAVDLWLQRAVGGMLVLTALTLLLGVRVPPLRGRAGRLGAIVLGFAAGLLVAWTSVGSGALFLPLLLALGVGPIPRVVGTDVVHGFLLTLAAGVGHLALGTVDLGLALHLVAGSAVGVLLGARMTRRIPEARLKVLVGAALLALGVRLL